MRGTQAGVLVVGQGSVPRICEEGGLWGKPSAEPVRGHRVDGLYPQHPRLCEPFGAVRRSPGWGARGKESPSRVTEASNEARGCSFASQGRRVRGVGRLWQVLSIRPGPRSAHRPAPAPLPRLLPLPPHAPAWETWKKCLAPGLAWSSSGHCGHRGSEPADRSVSPSFSGSAFRIKQINLCKKKFPSNTSVSQ